MKKTKLFLILLFSFFITGCSFDYNLTITSDNKVIEKVEVMSLNDDLLLHNEFVDLYLNEQIESYKKIPDFSLYTFSKKIGDVNSSVFLKKQYDSLENYIKSPTFKSLFTDGYIEKTNQYTSFTTSAENLDKKIYGDNLLDENFYVGDINIKIKFYNKVIDSNADLIDEKNNIYIWNIVDKNLTRNIYFKVGNEKRYDIIIIDTIQNNLLLFIGIIILVILATFTAIYVYGSLKTKDKI